ncbi:hypothetical protein ABEF95_007675 [Exophiala dermatitidis]
MKSKSPMRSKSDERTPLLARGSSSSSGPHDNDNDPFSDPHKQFCMLVGVPSSAPDPSGGKRGTQYSSSSSSTSFKPPKKSLYGRATRQLRRQRFTYYFTASLSNTLLLSQVVLGAALTALGASESSHILITVFGAMNTIIAGLVAYLKSRGQPMRARMFRDDLERVVHEIENSEVMWLGITRHVHGYDDIDTDAHQVTVRSEVARLTRLYDRAVRTSTANDPDMYMAGAPGHLDPGSAGLRTRPAVPVGAQPGVGVVPGTASPLPVAPLPLPQQPVVAAPVLSGDQPAADAGQGLSVPAPAPDPDESPATAVKPPPPPPKEEPKKDAGVKDENEIEPENGDKSKSDEGKGPDPGPGEELPSQDRGVAHDKRADKDGESNSVDQERGRSKSKGRDVGAGADEDGTEEAQQDKTAHSGKSNASKESAEQRQDTRPDVDVADTNLKQGKDALPPSSARPSPSSASSASSSSKVTHKHDDGSSEAPTGSKANTSPSSAPSSATSLPPQPPSQPPQQQPFDPDASPATDPNVPRKKTAPANTQ